MVGDGGVESMVRCEMCGIGKAKYNLKFAPICEKCYEVIKHQEYLEFLAQVNKK